jgi:hypothetical protein
MSDKQETAVDWLFEQLCSEKSSWNKDSRGKLFFDKITSNILHQAKEMEFKAKTADYIRGFNKGIETAAQLLKGDI